MITLVILMMGNMIMITVLLLITLLLLLLLLPLLLQAIISVIRESLYVDVSLSLPNAMKSTWNNSVHIV